MKVLKTNAVFPAFYAVEKREDGTLAITREYVRGAQGAWVADGKPANNAGWLINGKGVVKANADNVYVLLNYLNCRNWGAWGQLPRMSVGYSCNQYDCDGRTATTIILDRPIIVDGESGTRFEIGAPHGYLRNYRRIVPDSNL